MSDEQTIRIIPPAAPRPEYVQIFRIWIGLLSFAAAGWLTFHYGYAKLDFNLAFRVAPVGIAITLLWCFVVNLIRRKSILLGLKPALIVAGVLTYAMLLVCGQSFLQEHWFSPEMKAFASADFAEFDPTNSGAVTLQRLEDAQRKNETVQTNLRNLASAEAAVSESQTDVDLKARAFSDIAALERAERVKLRPAEQMNRIGAVSFNACRAGTRVTINGAQTCEVTRAELNGYDELLATQYPIWQKLFETVHLL